MEKYIVNPYEIEEKSMEIIESIMDDADKFNSDELKVVKRIIHTTADFEYSKLIKFNNEPIEKCKQLLSSGCKIYADTEMIKVGVNRIKLKELGCEICNYVHDDDVRITAKEKGITRSMASIEKAVLNNDIKIFLIGNAPTALYKLIELFEGANKVPPLIIGVPIGFVGAAESKEELTKRENIPFITIRGRKGGSTVAVSIINAILKMI